MGFSKVNKYLYLNRNLHHMISNFEFLNLCKWNKDFNKFYMYLYLYNNHQRIYHIEWPMSDMLDKEFHIKYINDYLY